MIEPWLLISIFPLAMSEKQVCNKINLKFTDSKRTSRSNSSICNRDFSVSYIRNHEPYVYDNNESILFNMIEQCCGHCTNITVSKNLLHIGEFDPKLNDAPDFVYPVLAKAGTLKRYGYYFVPVYRLESVIYISRVQTKIHLIAELMESGPLLFISFGLTLMAGFIMWSFETWKNEEQFPRAFPIGWFQAIWFSFVSMTTVGYGDQAPKSVVGKLFAIIWIYMGVILCSMITATITSSLLNRTTPQARKMEGMRIGMIKHRDFEGFVTASLNGLKVIEVEGKNSFYQLLKELKKSKIDGIVIERRAYHYINRGYKFYLQSNETTQDEIDYYVAYHKPIIDFFIYETSATEEKYTGPELYYGILMKEKEYNDYFGTIIEDNLFELQRKIDEYLLHIYYSDSLNFINFVQPSTASTLFSTKSYYFQTTAMTFMSINVALAIIGIIYEIMRRRKINRINKDLDDSNV